jgi:hypothetical protein
MFMAIAVGCPLLVLFTTTLSITEHCPETVMTGNFRYIPEDQKRLVLTMFLRGMKAKEKEDTGNRIVKSKPTKDDYIRKM